MQEEGDVVLMVVKDENSKQQKLGVGEGQALPFCPSADDRKQRMVKHGPSGQPTTPISKTIRNRQRKKHTRDHTHNTLAPCQKTNHLRVKSDYDCSALCTRRPTD